MENTNKLNPDPETLKAVAKWFDEMLQDTLCMDDKVLDEDFTTRWEFYLRGPEDLGENHYKYACAEFEAAIVDMSNGFMPGTTKVELSE